MGDIADDEQEQPTAQANPVRKRQRSPLAFPYSDLQRAIELCDKLLHLGGTSPVELTQLAAELNQTADGGTFRGRIGAARMFGLADYNTETAHLTEHGKAILDPVTAPAAKVEAFMRVPLYAKLYSSYQGISLPPAAALERQMVLLGLPQKQVERARQVFAASVDTAGFINNNGRFVKPIVSARADPEREDADKAGERDEKHEKPDTKRKAGGGDGGGGKDHPLINGLLVTLPEPGTVWDRQGRQAWLKMAESIFNMIYKDAGQPTSTSGQIPNEFDALNGTNENGG